VEPRKEDGLNHFSGFKSIAPVTAAIGRQTDIAQPQIVQNMVKWSTQAFEQELLKIKLDKDRATNLLPEAPTVRRISPLLTELAMS
jgi:hypothetical protein